MVGALIGVLIVGLIAGYVGKALLPGKDPGGFWVTIAIGIAGSFVGWLIFTGLLGIGDNDKFDFGGIIGAIIGTMILLFAYRRFVASRAASPAGTSASPPAAERAASRREKREHAEQAEHQEHGGKHRR